MGRDIFKEHEKLKAEIQREKAEALGRAGERLEDLLRKLVELRSTIESLGGKVKEVSPERGSLLEDIRLLAQEHNAFRKKAITYHRYLVIQREAVGFRDHRDMERLYRVPDPIDAHDFTP